jgi:1-aminocyclopropane-1-carboxylate deaminase
MQRLAEVPRVRLACLPTPIHPLPRLSAELGGPELWVKRDDLTGLAGGGNKTRKLEFLIADALREGARTLVTCGGVQSNHNRQTAAAAARAGLDCVLLHNTWAPPASADYGRVGNALLSSVLGATIYHDPTERAIGDEGLLSALVEHLRARGRRPYLIPSGASEHRLGGLGYVVCAAEIVAQERDFGVNFDWVVHCTGSSSTQAGLLAGLAALGSPLGVVGVADDGEATEKQERVLRLANATLEELGLRSSVTSDAVRVVVADGNPYGIASRETYEAIRLLAGTEGIVADPVYEGKALRGLIDLVEAGVLDAGQRVLLLHLGGLPAVHAYAEQLWTGEFEPLPDFDSPDRRPLDLLNELAPIERNAIESEDPRLAFRAAEAEPEPQLEVERRGAMQARLDRRGDRPTRAALIAFGVG